MNVLSHLTIFEDLSYVYVCISVCGDVHVCAGSHGDQRHQNPIELKLQVVVSQWTCVLRSKLRSRARVVPVF